MASAAAARHARVCRRLCLYRPAGICRRGADVSARLVRLDQRAGLLVPADSFARRSRHAVLAGALPLRLSALQGGLHRAEYLRAGSEPPARLHALAGLPARGAAARPPGGGHRRHPRPDGNLERSGRSRILCTSHLYGRHLRHLDEHGQCRRRGPARACASGCHRRSDLGRARRPASAAVPPHERALPAAGAAAPFRLGRGGRVPRLRAAGAARLPPALGGARLVCGDGLAAGPVVQFPELCRTQPDAGRHCCAGGLGVRACARLRRQGRRAAGRPGRGALRVARLRGCRARCWRSA